MPISRLILCVCLLLLPLAACRTLTGAGEEFEKSSKAYNRMLRWQEMDQAAAAFVDKGLRPQFQQQIEAAKGVKVVDYRVKSLECDPEKGEAEVRVEFDYYVPPSTTVKTADDLQKWVYREENGKMVWRLTTLPPAFKEK